MENNLKLKKSAWVKIIAAILIAVLSFGFLAEKAAKPDFYGGTIAALEEKQKDVMGLTAGLAGSATLIAALPSDTTTPIANQMMQLSDYLLIVLCTIFLEKYLITVLGFAAFKIVIPIVCILYLISVFSEGEMFRMLYKKMLILGLVFLFAIPAGVKVSEIVENTYEMSVMAAEDEDTAALIRQMEESEETEGMLTKIFDKVKDSAMGVTEKAKDLLNGFIERVAVMVVTSCLIPIAVLFCIIWIIKTIVGIELPAWKRGRRKPREFFAQKNRIDCWLRKDRNID